MGSLRHCVTTSHRLLQLHRIASPRLLAHTFSTAKFPHLCTTYEESSPPKPKDVTDPSGRKMQVAAQLQRNQEAGSMSELVRDFLDPAEFYQALKAVDIDYFCGVPDSLLKDFCAYVTTSVPRERHIITSNEGSAVAMATGYHLATGKSALVYLQNSGIGNIVNPVMSLADRSVYSIPMLLLIGWRGEPGKKDEPQHNTQGKATPNLLASMGVPVQTLPDYKEGAIEALQTASQHLKTARSPYCLLVRRQTFLPYRLPNLEKHSLPLVREEVIQHVIDCLRESDVVVGTTGMTSRELFEYRMAKGQGHQRDFLTVGSMGHASAISLGIANQKPDRQVFCLDGDGAAIMHMGTMATIGQNGPINYKHVLINNGTHDSVGGQPTDAGNHEGFSFTKIALGCGYRHAWIATTPEEIKASIETMRELEGPVLVEVKCRPGYRKNLGRPNRTPVQNKAELMSFLGPPRTE